MAMSCDLMWSFENEVLSTASTNNRFKWKTQWFLVADGASVSVSIRVASIGTNFEGTWLRRWPRSGRMHPGFPARSGRGIEQIGS